MRNRTATVPRCGSQVAHAGQRQRSSGSLPSVWPVQQFDCVAGTDLDRFPSMRIEFRLPMDEISTNSGSTRRKLSNSID
jgi:hypothetical protein